MSVMEVCVESVAAAVLAEGAGADRIELCSSLTCGGLTPSRGLMMHCKRSIRIPVFAMIRPREGDFCFTEDEIKIMIGDIEGAKIAGMDGLVLAVSREDGAMDVARLSKLVVHSRPLPVTISRAFDLAPDPFAALEGCIACGAKRILTSGQETCVADGLQLVQKLVVQAKDRICIVPGSGITPKNVFTVLTSSGASEFHLSGRDKPSFGEILERRLLIEDPSEGNLPPLTISSLKFGFGVPGAMPSARVLRCVKTAANEVLQIRQIGGKMKVSKDRKFPAVTAVAPVAASNRERSVCVPCMHAPESLALAALVFECGKDVVLAGEFARALSFSFEDWALRMPAGLPRSEIPVCTRTISDAFQRSIFSYGGCLQLDCCGLRDNHIPWLLEAVYAFLSSLKTVDVSYNELSDRGIAALCTALRGGKIELLCVSDNHLTDAAAPAFAQFIAESPSLTGVNLANNKIHDAGATIVAEAIAKHRNVQMLALSDNPLTDLGRQRIVRILPEYYLDKM